MAPQILDGTPDPNEVHDGRKATLIYIDTKEWIIQEMLLPKYKLGLSSTGSTEEKFNRIMEKINSVDPADEISIPNDNLDLETPMMKMVNYHVKIVKITSWLKEFNQMEPSEGTRLRENRLPFRGAVDC